MSINTKNSADLRKKIRWGLLGVFVLFVAALVFVLPTYANKTIDKINGVVALGLPRIPEKTFNLGLDLQGGAHLIYRADVSKVDADGKGESVEGVRDVIERRVNGLGISEPTVQTTKVGEEYNIIVDLPGVSDIKQAIKMIGETPILEFREENKEPPRDLTAAEKKEMDKFNSDLKKKAEDVLTKIKKGADFAEMAKLNSDHPTSKNNGGYLGFVNKYNTDLSSIYAWASKAKPDEVSKTLINNNDGYFIVKRGEEKDGEVEVSAKHILVCYSGAQGCEKNYTKEEAKKKAEEAYQKVNASNFNEIVKEYSTDPSAELNNGDLGSFPKGLMIKEFEDAVFSAKDGQIVGPVETPFGYHVIYKTGQSVPKEYAVNVIFFKTKKAADYLPPQDQYVYTGLSGKQLKRAEVVTDQTSGAVQVSLTFNDEGKKLFGDITERNLGKKVAIYLDGKPISEPTVQNVIREGQAVISGDFSIAEARTLAQRLNAGALPVPVELVSQQNVGATLGAEALQKSLTAGIIGFIVVILFMILYYRLPGLIASLALVVYTSLTLAIFKLIGVTLTLSGIAGFILSIGMAVDANVLIFERMKEEMKRGKSLKMAVEEGFARAWPSIRDSNISSFFTGLLLVWFGTSFVKGFAMTLVLGIMVHMFTAITVTRVMLRFIVPWFPEFANKLFLGSRKQTVTVNENN